MTPREKAYGEGFGTHLPLLASVIAIARPGPVFEIGVGHCSTPLIAEMCKAMERDHHVKETSHVWLESVCDLEPRLSIPSTIAVAFIDCAGPDRLLWAETMRNLAEFIVIHDTDNQGGDLTDLIDYLDTFPHRYDYKSMCPWTTVVSMTRSYL